LRHETLVNNPARFAADLSKGHAQGLITIKAQASPRNATRYFAEHLSHDDYYSDKEQTVGRWFGRTCDAFGIEENFAV